MDARKQIILVVNDEVAVLGAIRHFLAEEGYTVLSVDKAQSALQIASDVIIDLLLADVFMPWMTAKSLSHRIASLQPGLKVIFMTGYSKETLIDHGMVPAGAVILQKPISRNGLIRQVHETLASGTVWQQVSPKSRVSPGSLVGTENPPE
jgi:DNA-binding NtrC family response regulator